MATVTSFESMAHRGRHEMRQFSELFVPVFKASTVEARRNAVAALSRCPAMPKSVARFLASQPIALAAIFITNSPALDDEILIEVARTQGTEHAKAVAARANLSVKVVDALVAIHQGHAGIQREASTIEEPKVTDASAARDEELRSKLKSLVYRQAVAERSDETDHHIARQDALLVRFARSKQAHGFSQSLAHALGCSRWLTNRILLDLSGLQLASALIALEMEKPDIEFILGQFYPHLGNEVEGRTRASSLLMGLDAAECADRVRLWIRADHDVHDAEAKQSANINHEDASVTYRAIATKVVGF